ncbi:Cobalt-precorrin-6x reductase [hydrothermal vent metagenome]|uniref:Cobalt-precorrin-6x reductase n=1 Tax=hydrothermal vent metagenome TaxID=652676 RepID=A0A3B1BYD7_9ZZZZ
MILLFGGTSDAAEISERVAKLGYKVLVSTATDVELNVGSHKLIKRQVGRINLNEIKRLITDRGIKMVIDATHPYAEIVRNNARTAAKACNVPYLTFMRPAQKYDYENIFWAETHKESAEIAFSSGKTVFTMTGSKDIATYAKQSKEKGVALVARVLNHPQSIESCRIAGIASSHIVAGRGPFTVEQNLEQIRAFKAGVIVTKDSGVAGGVLEKMEAAKQAGAIMVIVKRPQHDKSGSFETIKKLIEAFQKIIYTLP